MQFEKELSIHPSMPLWFFGAMAAGLILLTLFSYSRTHRELVPGLKAILIGLRLFACGLAVLCLLRPSMATVEFLQEKGWVFIFQDNSRSMLIKDMPPQMTRSRSVSLALGQQRLLMDQLEAEYPNHVNQFVFGQETRPMAEEGPSWSDKTTDLGNALEKARRMSRGKRIAGIVLFSDGTNNHGADPVQIATSLHDLAAPLYVFGVGKQQSAAVRDARVVNVITPSKVFSGNLFPIDAEVHFLGLEGEQANVVFKLDDNEVARQTVEIKSNQDVQQIRFMHREIQPGSHHVNVEVETVPGEISDRNNSQGTFVEVVSGGLNVLYLEGQFRHEFTFIRRSLSESPNVILTSPFPFQVARRERMSRFLKENELSQYHAIIIGDVPSAAFAPETLQVIKRLIERRGIGLAVIGGYENLGKGGYGETALADALPIVLEQTQGQDDKVTRVIPTAVGREHFLMTLESDSQANTDAWEKLPALAGLTLAGRPKPAAHVLAVSERDQPVIIVQDYGRGRTAAIMMDTTYRWRMGQPKEVAIRHRKFWRQVVLWLASRDKLGEKSLRLSLDKFSYQLGEETRIFAEVTDEKGNPVSAAKVSVTVRHESEKDPVSLPSSFHEDHFEAQYAAVRDGVYVVKAAAEIDGEPIGERETRFQLTTPDREFDNPQADLKLLMKVAEASGGSFHVLDDVPSVLEEIRDKKLATEIRREHHDEIWDNYVMFSLFVLTMMIEWIVRRRHGLV